MRKLLESGVPPEQGIKDTLEEPIPIGEFQHAVKSRNLLQEFMILNNITCSKPALKRLVDHDSLDSLNRYSDILPIEETRVQLAPRNEQPTYFNSYINANFADVSHPNLVL